MGRGSRRRLGIVVRDIVVTLLAYLVGWITGDRLVQVAGLGLMINDTTGI